jgi:hypothetical protein
VVRDSLWRLRPCGQSDIAPAPLVRVRDGVDAFTIGKDINGSNGQTYNSTITYDFQAT